MSKFVFFLFACMIVPCASAPVRAANVDVLQRVRADGVVHCAGIVRPGIAVPTIDGKHWYGIAPDVCRAVAAAVLGDPARMTFRPYVRGEAIDGSRASTDDLVFLTSAELVPNGSVPGQDFELGPIVVHDALALLVPASGASDVLDLRDRPVCVEPGSDADRALVRFFTRRDVALREHPFQETDEMRQAYGDGRCAALAGPLTTLASVRADPEEGRSSDRILPEFLADDPVFCATSGDARWSQIVWWTFSALVDAEDAGIRTASPIVDAAIPGVPPAVAKQLGLAPTWIRDAIAAGGNYGEIFERNLGGESRFHLPRADNASVRNGGAIFALRVE